MLRNHPQVLPLLSGELMKTSWFIFQALCLLLVALNSQAISAQTIACSADDDFCLQRQMEIACREENSTRSSCEAFLDKLQHHPNSSQISWRLAQAPTYMSLADFASVSALADVGSVSEEEAVEFRKLEKEILTDVVRRNPTNSEALLGMANVSETIEGQIYFLKRTVAADPDNHIAVRGLVSRLLSENPDAWLESAQLLEKTLNP